MNDILNTSKGISKYILKKKYAPPVKIRTSRNFRRQMILVL